VEAATAETEIISLGGQDVTPEMIQQAATEIRRLAVQGQQTMQDRLAILEAFMVNAAVLQHLYTAAVQNMLAQLQADLAAATGAEVADPVPTVDLDEEGPRFERAYLYSRLLMELGYLRAKTQASKLIVPTKGGVLA
jgi:hypothetical protein